MESFSIESVQVQALSNRVDELTHRLADRAPYCEAEQKQLDDGSVEQAYWHYGYACALRDVLSMINRRSS